MEPIKTPVPNRFCDVVMKGGITSGVVYPLAVVRLAEKFRLKHIGGTSAGAIAASAAAAAELGRATGGFERLKNLPAFLSSVSPDGKRTNLLAFFQPQPGTKPLFEVGLAALGGGRGTIWRVLRAAQVEFPVEGFLGSLPGLGLLVGAWFFAEGGFFFGCLLAAVTLIGIGFLGGLVAAFAWRMKSELPQNFYGLCSGMSEGFYDTESVPPPLSRGKPLTYWLMEYLNETAGRKNEDPPLTFGDLWGTKDPNGDRRIDLQMMTTCLTHGRPYRLPFRMDEDLSENQFYFRRDEFERLFPKRVVDWLAAHPRKPSGKNDAERAESLARRENLAKRGIHPMPEPADLPLVVAVRMSLSFPILLSAVPLHAVERRRDPEGDHPERCWFSDGGVCSNFPVHFFDSALPRHPTLGIDLAEKPTGTCVEALIPEMVRTNSSGIQERWNRFEIEERLESGTKLVAVEKSGFGKLAGFVGALVRTMQNWTDNTQARLPGFRDRIIHVPLTPDEGGLNLNMPDDLIKSLTTRGEQAGQLLLDHFAVPPCVPEMTWDNHRWLRMRSLLASLEKMLGQVETACASPEGGDIPYDEWIKLDGKPPSYDWESPEQRKLALETLTLLRRVARVWQSVETAPSISAAEEAPRPRPELRPRAQI